MFTILDCNNFWSPTGGGVRRYHLQKIEYFRKRSDIRYVFLMSDNRNETEYLNDNTIIEHYKAPKVPGHWEYRFSVSAGQIAPLIKKHQPDAIEAGSPYFMPHIVRKSIRSLKKKPKVFGFWHADYPVTYVHRAMQWATEPVAKWAEHRAWDYARFSYNWMNGIFVSSHYIIDRMERMGMRHMRYVPLGTDVDFFSPAKKDLKLERTLKAGIHDRPVFFFPHRFSREKGTHLILSIYPRLCKEMGIEPAIVFAGTGPYLPQIIDACEHYPHIHYIGFIENRDELARYYATAQFGFALSNWETFGLSTIEALASGQILVGATEGAAKDHIETSKAGVSVPYGDEEALIQAIIRICSCQEKELMSRRAQHYAARFSWDACFESEIHHYTGI